MRNEKPIAVTGASGFVGSHLVKALLAKGCHVRVLVRDKSAYQNLDERIEVIQGDLANHSALKKLLEGTEILFHCGGAIAGLNRKSFFCVNQAGAVNIARAAREANITRFVHVSSLAAREPGLSFYAESKAAGEQVVQELISPDKLVVVRPPAVYGPGDKATFPLIKMLGGKLAILPGLKHQRISWIFVGDLVDALIGLATAEKVPDQIVEIDDGRENGYSWGELVDCASQAKGEKIKLVLLPRFIVTIASWFALAKAKLTRRPDVFSPQKVSEIYHQNWVAGKSGLSGWQAKTGFKDGFLKTLFWYRQNHWLPGGTDSVKKP